jgi:hypothetical protein
MWRMPTRLDNAALESDIGFIRAKGIIKCFFLLLFRFAFFAIYGWNFFFFFFSEMYFAISLFFLPLTKFIHLVQYVQPRAKISTTQVRPKFDLGITFELRQQVRPANNVRPSPSKENSSI